MGRTKLIHDRLTHSVIGAFFEVYYTLGFGFLEHVYAAPKSTRALHDGAVRQVENYLRATTLELGLLLRFGPQPKFYRVIASNSRTPDPKSPFSRVPSLPRVPRNPSVSVAGGEERPPTGNAVSVAIPVSEPKC